MALQRALESSRPASSRLFTDPYARAFTTGRLAFLAWISGLPLIGHVAPTLYDVIAGPGPRPSAVARTRLIDDLIQARATEFDQLVILGAGFDTRPSRLASLHRVEVFEVDQPQTQARKRDVMQRCHVDQ